MIWASIGVGISACRLRSRAATECISSSPNYEDGCLCHAVAPLDCRPWPSLPACLGRERDDRSKYPRSCQARNAAAALAVIALVIESALATIFQWRVYRMVFNNRSTKTLVMIAVALIVVMAFGYDIF